MRRRFNNNVRILFSILFVSSVIAFNFVQIKVYAAPLTELDGIHAFADTYFDFNGSNTAESDDGKFLLSASKYNLNSDDHSAWIDDADTVTEETVYLEVKNHGTLGSFNLESVDLGEYQDGVFKDVHVEGYSNGKKVFSTMAYSNLKDGVAVKNFPLNLEAAKGKNIDSFRICYTKGAGIDSGHYDFNIYSFTISNASTDLPADKTPPAAVTNITVSDNDTTSGIDGRDFTIGFADSADDASDVSGYRIYIYKDGEEPTDKAAMDALPAGSKAAVKTIARTAGDDGTDANLGIGITTDSKGQALSAGDYWVIVTAQDSAGNYSFAKASAKAAITDDMPPSVTLSISGSTISENGGVATITATLSNKSYQPVTVGLSLTGSAINLIDYTLSSNSIVIPAGSLTGTVTLTAKDNAVYEGNKTVIVDISGVVGGVESGSQKVTATIADDDTVPSVILSEDRSSISENGGTAIITATLSNKFYRDVTVSLGLTGTAVKGIDYTASAATIVIPAGSLTGSAILMAKDNAVYDGDKTVIVDISGVTGGVESGTERVTVVILEDDKIVPGTQMHSDQNFDGLSAAESTGSLNVGSDLVFTSDAGKVAIAGASTLIVSDISVCTGVSDKVITNDNTFMGNPKLFQFSSSDLSNNFRMNSMSIIITDMGSGKNVNITGYDDGLQVAGITSVDMSATKDYEVGTDNAVTFTNQLNEGGIAEYGGVITFTGRNWSNVDTIKITNAIGGQPVYIVLDSLDFDEPVTLDSTIATVSVPSNGTYKAGQNLDFTVNLSEAVIVDTTRGKPYIELTLSTGGTVKAEYVSGSGTTVLLFRYTVVVGNEDSDGIGVGTSIKLNGGTISDTVGNVANLTLCFAPSTSNVFVDAIVPTVTYVSVPYNGTYKAGQNLDFTVNFSENVKITGTDSVFVIDIGGIERTATYLSKTSNSITYRYIVQNGDNNGISLGTIILKGTTIEDAATNDAIFMLNSVGETSGVIVDTTAPMGVTNITLQDNDTTSGIDGRDFTIGFADSADDASGYRIYIYKDGEEPADKAAMDALPADSKAAVKTITRTAGNDGSAANLGNGVTTDSKGQALAAGDYWVIVTAQDAAGNYSFAKASSKAAIIDDMPPSVTLSISGTTISENGGVAAITAALSNKSYQPVTVDLSLTGSAINLTDYTLSSNSIVIPAGSLTGTVTLKAKDNAVYEGDKTVIVDISGVSGGVESGSQKVTAVILEDDKIVHGTATPSDQTFDGKNVGGTDTVTLDGIRYTTNNGGRLEVAGCNTLSFNSAITSSAYSGNAMANDLNLSAAPTFFQVSSEDLADNFKFNSMYYIITDFGDGHKINIEGFDGGKNGTLVASAYGIDMSASGDYGTDTVTVANQINDTANGEYGGILHFGNNWNDIDTILITNNAGNTKAVYSVIDSLDFSNVADVSVSDAVAVTEGGNAKFTILLSKPYSDPVTAHYATADNTAKAAYGDYTSTSGTATIPAGQTSVEVTIPINDDTDYENIESFYLNISNPSVGGITDSQGECTITDNDSQPSVDLSISSSSFSETGGSATVTATLSNKSYQPVTVNLSFSGTATSGTDYTKSDSIVIPAGSLSNYITITGVNDTTYEGNETIIAEISSVTNGKKGTCMQVSAAITDDDTPSISISDALGYEGNSGTTDFTFTVSLSNPSPTTVTVDYATSGDTAAEGADYTAQSGTITFAPGETTKTITIEVNGDTTYEGNETFYVDLSNVSAGIDATDAHAVGTIIDDDATAISGSTVMNSTAPRLTGEVTDIRTYDGNVGDPKYFMFVPSSSEKYTIKTLGTVDTEGELFDINGNSLDVKDDGGDPPNFLIDYSLTAGKTYYLRVTNYTTDGDSTKLLISGDSGGTLQLTDTIAPEAVTNITLKDNDTTSGIDGRDFTVGFTDSEDDASDVSSYKIYIYKDGEEPADKAAMDALPVGSRTAVKTIARTAGDDGADANLGSGVTTDSKGQALATGDYWVIVTAQDTASNYSFVKSSVKAEIIDDMPPSVMLSISGSAISENGGVAAITAALSNKSYQPVTVDLSLTGSAINLTDYTLSSNSIVIPAGSLAGTITLTAKDNAVYEGDKTIVVDISSVTNGTENGRQQVTAILADDEPAPLVTLSKSAATITENRGSVILTASLSVQSIEDITVNLGYTGTATQGSDYTVSGAAITIPAGSLSGTVTITGLDDTGYEGAETVIADITSVIGGIENGTQQQTVTITDDDSAPTVSLGTNKASISENCGTAEITATLSNKSYQDVTIDLSLTGSAISFTDYAASANSIVIPAGSISGLIKLAAKDNDIYEGDKTVVVDIAGITNGAENGKQQVNVSITDNETTPSVTLSVAGSPFSENGGTATITATLSNKSYQPVTVDLSLTGSAINLTDYTASSNSIFIPAGSLTGSAILTAKDNAVYEGDKTVIVNISSVTNGTENGTQQLKIDILENEVVPPSSQYLSNLTISSGIFAPAFNKNTYSYTATVGCDVASITITPTAEVPTAYGQNATVKVNGITVASGAGTPVNLSLGVNTIYVDVTSAVGNVTQRYTLTVTREDTYLSNLTATLMISTTNLLGAFDKTVTTYSASIARNTKVKITATADSPQNVTLTIGGAAATSGTALPVSVTPGITNAINIIVTSISTGDTKTYKCNIAVAN